MIDESIFLLTFVSALGCGVIGGVFFAFSTFVMKALAQLAPPHGITAMQSINIAVINPSFMLAFLGTGALCLVLAVWSVFRWQESSSRYLLAGSLLYLIGTILVTMVCNVPQNNTLAVIDPTSAEGASLWNNYLRSWTAWNHVRAVAAIAAAASFTFALWQRS
jgi:uncharacterized membrane protein